ncbi:hypothetical protein AYX13_07097 [Cryptococcus neoformans]|nr:hypothetical protein AYX13_07097 [Cryptococcus neoformans var. grubii]
MFILSVYGEHGCLSLHGFHSANYCIRWLFLVIYPRRHPRLHRCLHPRLRPVPHAALEFILPITDSSTRLSLNARRICSATPQHRYSSTSDSSHPTRSLSLGYPSTLAQLRDR